MKIILVAFVLVAVVSADVSELGQPPSNYLPPGPSDLGPGPSEPIPAPLPLEPTQEYIPPEVAAAGAEEPAPAHVLAEDGYRYKTVRRIRYRHRV